MMSLLSGKSTEPKVAKEHAASCEVDDSQGAKDHRRGVLRLRLTVPALPPEHLRSARREEPTMTVVELHQQTHPMNFSRSGSMAYPPQAPLPKPQA